MFMYILRATLGATVVSIKFSSLPYVYYVYVMYNGNDLLYIEFAMTTNVPKLKYGASLVYKCY